jgi:hypothetical protein
MQKRQRMAPWATNANPTATKRRPRWSRNAFVRGEFPEVLLRVLRCCGSVQMWSRCSGRLYQSLMTPYHFDEP